MLPQEGSILFSSVSCESPAPLRVAPAVARCVAVGAGDRLDEQLSLLHVDLISCFLSFSVPSSASHFLPALASLRGRGVNAAILRAK